MRSVKAVRLFRLAAGDDLHHRLGASRGAVRADGAIGDDRLQRQATGYVSPDSFTHGSSEQRQRWFRRGIESGSLEACDSFGAAEL